MPFGKEANKVLEYIKKKYGTEPEFLWLRFPSYAVLRHKDSTHWYALLLTIPSQKLGLSGEGSVDILDLKCDPMLISTLIDKKTFFPAYHMNKAHWISVLLNGTIKDKYLFSLIDQSYDISR